MKKFSTVVITVLLGASLAFAQTGGDKSTLNPQPLPPGRHPNTTADTATTTKGKSGKKGHHKGGKKSKKGSSSGTTQPSTPPK